MEVRFRRAIIGDAAAICGLYQECFGDPPTFDDIDLIIRSTTGASCHICHLGTELVGAAYAVKAGCHWRLGAIAVAPKWRRSKYATGLLARLGRDLAAGVLLSAFANERNDAAIAFLNATGFAPLKLIRRSGGDLILFIIRRVKE